MLNVPLMSVAAIEVALDRPRVNELAAGLTNRSECDELAGHRRAELLFELPPRCGERIFVGVDLTLRNRPGALVLLRPQRAARVHEQDLDASRCAPKQQQSCTLPGHAPIIPDHAYHSSARRDRGRHHGFCGTGSRTNQTRCCRMRGAHETADSRDRVIDYEGRMVPGRFEPSGGSWRRAQHDEASGVLPRGWSARSTNRR